MKALKRINVYTRLQKRERFSLTRKAGEDSIYIFDAAHFHQPRLVSPFCNCGCLNEEEHASKLRPVACILHHDFEQWIKFGRTTWPATLAFPANDLIIAAGNADEPGTATATLKAKGE